MSAASTQTNLPDLCPTAGFPSHLADRIRLTLADINAPRNVRDTLLALLNLTDAGGAFDPVSLIAVLNHMRSVLHCRIDERGIKDAIKRLVEDYGVAIGSARGKLHGYFFIVSDEDAAIAAAPLLAEIRSLAKRCRTLSPRNPYILQLCGQMEIEETMPQFPPLSLVEIATGIANACGEARG